VWTRFAALPSFRVDESRQHAPVHIWLGQRSYEIYLTHMFVVIGFFVLFTQLGRPLRGVPILFVAVVLAAALLGDLVARFYSEPMNRLLRKRWAEAPNKLGSVMEAT
jgi:peptidoglycan/LPS O-acetylase OafA/YrhL